MNSINISHIHRHETDDLESGCSDLADTTRSQRLSSALDSNQFTENNRVEHSEINLQQCGTITCFPYPVVTLGNTLSSPSGNRFSIGVANAASTIPTAIAGQAPPTIQSSGNIIDHASIDGLALENAERPSGSAERLDKQQLLGRSKMLGAIYLWGRFFEYVFKGAALLGSIDVKDSQRTVSQEEIAQILIFLGLAAGELGNIFQAYQGWADCRIANRFSADYAGTDKAHFGKIAMVRGGVNLIADTAAMVANAQHNRLALTVSLGAGGLTDVMGLYKNLRDTRLTHSIERFAYACCTVSRPLFIANSIAGLVQALTPRQLELFIKITALIGYLMFDLGALIRQLIYHGCLTSSR